MTATQKIEGLINSWYGYAVFGAALRFWDNGIGLWSLFTTGCGFLFAVVLTWFIGNRLKNRSSITRFILVVGSAILGVLGTLGAVRMGWTFLHTLSLTDLLYVGVTAVSVYMNAKSFKVLTDASVKSYFNAT